MKVLINILYAHVTYLIAYVISVEFLIALLVASEVYDHRKTKILEVESKLDRTPSYKIRELS